MLFDVFIVHNQMMVLLNKANKYHVGYEERLVSVYTIFYFPIMKSHSNMNSKIPLLCRS